MLSAEANTIHIFEKAKEDDKKGPFCRYQDISLIELIAGGRARGMALRHRPEGAGHFLSKLLNATKILDISQVQSFIRTIMSDMTSSESYCSFYKISIAQTIRQRPLSGETFNSFTGCNFVIIMYYLCVEYNTPRNYRRHLEPGFYSKKGKTIYYMNSFKQIGEKLSHYQIRQTYITNKQGSQYCVEQAPRCLNLCPLSPTPSPSFTPPTFLVYKALCGVYTVSLSIHRHAGYRRAH